MIKRLLATTFVVSGLAACNQVANSPVPIVERIEVAPEQVTDAATPFKITAVMRAGGFDTSGKLAPGLSRPGSFTITSGTTAEWRPTGDAGGPLPTAIVYLPVTLVGASGFGVVGTTQSQTIYLQFEPIAGGLTFKGYRTIIPSAAPSAAP